MAATKFLKIMSNSRPISSSSSSSISSYRNCSFHAVRIRCIISTSSKNGENWLSSSTKKNGEKKSVSSTSPVEVKAAAVLASGCVVTAPPRTDKMVDLVTFLANAARAFFAYVKGLSLNVIQLKPWRWHLQMLMEKMIVDCRFFIMLAVGGSLIGSLLCFVEGCVLVAECYLHYFHSLSHGGSFQEHLVHLLIEAIDMFLVATAMLVFGTGLHVMFVGSAGIRGKGTQFLQKPNFIKTLPERVGIRTIMQAKSKIGHAVLMILQVGMLEKFKSVPVVTGLDLACFAGAVFTSSISVFILSKLAGTVTK